MLPPPSIQFLANVGPGRRQIMARVLGSLITPWKTQTEYLASGFGLLQPQQLQGFGVKQKLKDQSLSVSLFQINKNKL